MIEHGEAGSRFKFLETKRTEVVDRAVRAAEITIPSIMPPEGNTEASKLKTPYQSLGAKAVNSLSSKILLALFPPNTAWFKIGLDDLTRADLGTDEAVAEANKNLSLVEQTVVAELEQTRLRSVIGLVSKHLVVTGNCVIDVMPDRSFRFLNLRHYVVERDPEGNVLHLVIKECVSPLSLPQETLEAVFDEAERKEFSTNPEKNIDLFTAMYREGNQYKVFQEINQKLVQGSEGSYPLESPRFIVLRWTSLNNEDYGRGMVDEYYGDLNALDKLSRDLLKASALAAKVVFTTDPNSFITPKVLEAAESGDVIKGKADDVGSISIDKLQDFKVVLDRHRDIQQDLAEAFLMNSSVQRNAERVTAEEIRFMAQELEDALGGVYSALAQDLQVPLLRRVLGMLGDAKLIPKLPDDGLNLSITTGLEALGRGHEINKLLGYIAAAREAVGEQELTLRLKSQFILTKLATGFGLDTEDMVRSDEEVSQAQQQAQAASMLQASAPGVAQEIAKQGGPQ